MKLPSFLPYDLGVASNGKRAFLYGNLLNFDSSSLFISVSNNGTGFKSSRKPARILDINGDARNTLFFKDFRVSKNGRDYYLMFKDGNSLETATSRDLLTWQTANTPSISETSTLVPDYKYKNQFVAYSGDKDISVFYSDSLSDWGKKKLVLSPRPNYFDRYPLQIGNVFNTEEGILVFYYVKEYFREGLLFSVGVCLFDKINPGEIVWRSSRPIITQQLGLDEGELYPLGSVVLKDQLFFYFGVRGKQVFVLSLGKFGAIFNNLPGRTKPRLLKHEKNPIIKPVLSHSWQSSATFNPAAVDVDNKVHFIYRAMGPQNISVLGHAESSNGVDITYRSEKPIYSPRLPFETPGGNPNAWFMSGGGYGGCEDPRITWIKEDNRFYLTYVAYNGAHAPRVAMSSISESDFKNKSWNWSLPKIISKPGVVNKNAVLFPEKVDGRYVVMHRIFPNILIDFLPDLDFKNPRYLKGEYKIPPTIDGWDSRKVGSGPPPIKTPEGWLLIYHAVDDKNDSQYKIGAMLLDLKEPWKVLYRTHRPILEPGEWYENEGFKSGVAYPCGAVIKNNTLFVYYGGADKFVCVASSKLDELLKELKTFHPIDMESRFEKRTAIRHYA